MRFWRNSPRDGVLVAFSVAELALKLFLLATFNDRAPWEIAAISFLLIALSCMNYECAGHYFIHRPFFVSRTLNALFGVLNSLAFGFPQTLYRTEHLSHHRYVSDFRDSATGLTKDASSVYRHGPADDEPEHILKYAAMSPLRQDAWRLIRETPRRLHGQLALEMFAVALLYAAALIMSPYALALLVFLSWAGSAATHVQNWLEHAHADPTSRMANAVSTYGFLYNLVWFNNGYHQEHHWRPSTHWADLPKLRRYMLPESQRRVVPHAHLWNLRAERERRVDA